MKVTAQQEINTALFLPVTKKTNKCNISHFLSLTAA